MDIVKIAISLSFFLKKEFVMFSMEVWLAYTLACLLLVISPGPDNIWR